MEDNAWIKFEEVEGGSGRFLFSPLERGMGVTIGNAMRRVLLSSIGGAAVRGVKIKGVDHEFSTIPNVVEDVLDIICNIKSLVLLSTGQGEKKISIIKDGAGKVYARDIKTDSSVTIINKDLFIAEVATGGALNIEMYVENQVGYRCSDLNKKEDDPVDMIVIDSSFSPIVKVNHSVENIRVGQSLDYESLELVVVTNGSISAEEAVQKGAKILIDQFNVFLNLNEKPQVVNHTVEPELDTKKYLDLAIDDLELSARSSNCLKRAGILTVEQLVNKDLSELSELKNFGKKSSDEINSKLKQYNLELKDEG